MNLGEINREAIELFNRTSIPNSQLEASLILSLALGKTKEYIISHPELEIDDITLLRIKELIFKRLSGIPYAYLSREKEFFGINFFVDYGVLVPRPETEALVEIVLREGPFDKGLDLFCGIGIIGLTILYNNGCKLFTGIDVSPTSIELAEKNSRILNLKDRTRFISGDIEEIYLEETFDLIVANPPYIPESEWEKLPLEVKNEPKDALLGGKDGLKFYPVIASIVRKNLASRGLFAVEIGGEGQVTKVEKIFRDYDLSPISVAYDLAGIPRVIWGRKE